MVMPEPQSGIVVPIPDGSAEVEEQTFEWWEEDSSFTKGSRTGRKFSNKTLGYLDSTR
jgi:hypothetical protein